MNRSTALALGSLLALLVGCAGDGSGIPDPVSPGCNGLEPRLECIQEMIFTPTCAVGGCHDAGTNSAGLTLEEGLAFGNLVGVDSSEVPSLMRVEPSNPDDSFLVIKLEGTDPRFVGQRMPASGNFLSSAEIQAIRDWIANGANDD